MSQSVLLPSSFLLLDGHLLAGVLLAHLRVFLCVSLQSTSSIPVPDSSSLTKASIKSTTSVILLLTPAFC